MFHIVPITSRQHLGTVSIVRLKQSSDVLCRSADCRAAFGDPLYRAYLGTSVPCGPCLALFIGIIGIISRQHFGDVFVVPWKRSTDVPCRSADDRATFGDACFGTFLGHRGLVDLFWGVCCIGHASVTAVGHSGNFEPLLVWTHPPSYNILTKFPRW